MIRKVYTDILKAKIASGDLPWLARAALRYPLIHLSSLIRKPLCGPILGTFIVTYRCNYACAMCEMPELGLKRADKLEEPGTEELFNEVLTNHFFQ